MARCFYRILEMDDTSSMTVWYSFTTTMWCQDTNTHTTGFFQFCLLNPLSKFWSIRAKVGDIQDELKLCSWKLNLNIELCKHLKCLTLGWAYFPGRLETEGQYLCNWTHISKCHVKPKQRSISTFTHTHT